MKEEKPDEELIPEATEEDIEETKKLVERAKGKAPSPHKIGNLECPVCGGTMRPSEELTFDVHLPNGYIVIPNLSGHKCEECGDKYFDPDSSSIIGRYTDERVSGGHEAKVTTVGGGKLGIYFPKDVLREMDIESKKKVVLKPISRKKAILEF